MIRVRAFLFARLDVHSISPSFRLLLFFFFCRGGGVRRAGGFPLPPPFIFKNPPNPPKIPRPHPPPPPFSPMDRGDGGKGLGVVWMVWGRRRLQNGCKNKVLNPTAYAYERGLPVSNKPTANPYKWTNETVSRILERLDYLGHTVNFKTTKQSFKSKKKLWNDPSEWVIFENTQEPIIEESVFLIVQKIRAGPPPSYQDGRHGECSPACCIVRIAAERCICAGPIISSLNRNITSVPTYRKDRIFMFDALYPSRCS